MFRNILPASLLFSLLGFAPAHAQWEVFKFAEIGATSTDNLQFGGEDDLVFHVKPSVEFALQGNRFNTDIVAELELFNFNERGDNIVDPRLLANTSGTLVDNLLFVSGGIEFGKVLPGEDFFDFSEDSDTQTRFRINPFLARQFGSTGDLFVGYGHQSLDNETDGEIDFQQNTLSFDFGRSPRLGGFVWGVGATYGNDRVTDDEEFQNFSAFARVGSSLTQTTFWELIVGAESNDFIEEGDNDEDDVSAFGEVRLNWAPSERTTLVVGYNNRFFGAGPLMSLSHRVRNSTITAALTREVSNADVTLSDISTFSDDTNPIIPTLDTDLIGDETVTDEGLFIDERLRLSYKLAGRRSDLVFDAVYSDQEQLDGGATREAAIGRLAFDRHLSPVTTVRFLYEHELEQDIDGENENENRFGVRLLFNFDRKERTSIVEEDI